MPLFDFKELKQNEIMLRPDSGGVTLYVVLEGELWRSNHPPWNKLKVRTLVIG